MEDTHPIRTLSVSYVSAPLTQSVRHALGTACIEFVRGLPDGVRVELTRGDGHFRLRVLKAGKRA